MASQTSIAIARARAIARIDAAMAQIAEETGQDYAPLSTQGRDPQTLVNKQFESLADALESLAASFAQTEPVDALDGEDADRDTEDAAPDEPEVPVKPNKKGAK